ncbi:mRNA turnover protein 4 homolog, partial [Vigna umbellata]|uniref:mRNA turnover protein 4 homolog n=1 Tax=Vigna umbellata TaxID=87088 RepID=UPI001F5EC6B5
MPKSKRNKQVTLSKTKKKGRDHKEAIVNGIKEAPVSIHNLYLIFLLRGDAGMVFTNLSKEEVERLFKEFEEYDFARTGSLATEKVDLKEGTLEQFTHEMEPFLRKQGMPVRLKKGVVELVSDFVVCEEGKSLSPEAARIL